MLRYGRVLALLGAVALFGCQGQQGSALGPEVPEAESEPPAALLHHSQVETTQGRAPACPDGFAQRSASLDPSVDRNNDGVICEKRAGGQIIRIDNPG